MPYLTVRLPDRTPVRRDARAGGAEVAEPLIQQISSMDPQQEEPEALFLPVRGAVGGRPRSRRQPGASC